VHPREIFACALKYRAASIILAHNHPSGDASPSEEDRIVTRRLHEAAKVMGIALLDHVVVTKTSMCSVDD
jgi:DNA repair protein RadC